MQLISKELNQWDLKLRGDDLSRIKQEPNKQEQIKEKIDALYKSWKSEIDKLGETTKLPFCGVIAAQSNCFRSLFNRILGENGNKYNEEIGLTLFNTTLYKNRLTWFDKHDYTCLYFHPEKTSSEKMEKMLSKRSKINHFVRKVFVSFCVFFVVCSERKKMIRFAQVESKLQFNHLSQEWESFFKQIEEHYLIFFNKKHHFHYKGPLKDFEFTLFQHRNDKFDDRLLNILKIAKSKPITKFEVGEFYDAAMQHLPILSKTMISLRNILRQINGINSFSGMFKQATKEELKVAIQQFAIAYDNFFAANDTMKDYYRVLNNEKPLELF